MKKIALAVLPLLLLANCYAGDSIIVHKDSRLDILIAKQAASNKVSQRMTPNGQYKGYRLQIAATHNRDDAFNAKALFLQNFPDKPSYVSYQSPNFRVRVGDFVNKSDAEKFKADLIKIFTDGVDIVEDVIEYTPNP
jgi:hypothetical protein